jgi:predicted nucleotidyltransferase
MAMERAGIRPTPRADAPVVAELLRRLVAAYRPERIYLFGSAARGDAGPDSDYDLLIVVPDSSAPERQDERLAYEALVGTGVSVDVLVYRASDFYSRLPLRASLPSTVDREGRLLYAA